MTADATTSAQRRTSAAGKLTSVVETLAHEGRTSRIAEATGLATSTVHRILQELVDLGWAREDGEHGYLLGPRLLALTGQRSDEGTIVRLAHPVLRALNEQIGIAVHFALRSGDTCVYVDKLDGLRPYRMRSRVGLAIPMHCTAIGKSVLAHMPEPEVRALVARTGLPGMTRHTLTDLDRLLTELRAVRRREFSVDAEENELGIRCVGAPVFDHRGRPIGGISVSALVHEMGPKDVRRVAPVVVSAAAEITAALGGRMVD